MAYIKLILSFAFIFIAPGILTSNSKRDAMKFIEKTCIHKADPGKKCKEEKEQKAYFFNVKTFRCSSFDFLGCGGNANRFGSSDDCIDSCQTPWFTLKNKNEEEIVRQKSDCQLAPEVGKCKAIIPMWYYDKEDKKCYGFSHGGCGGNGNRFNEEEECLKFCKV